MTKASHLCLVYWYCEAVVLAIFIVHNIDSQLQQTGTTPLIVLSQLGSVLHLAHSLSSVRQFGLRSSSYGKMNAVSSLANPRPPVSSLPSVSSIQAA